MKVEERQLGKTKLRVPCLGFGGGPIGAPSISVDDAVATVRAGLKHGLRYVDTAPLYGRGHSEVRLGRAFAGVPRSSYILATKVGRLLDPPAPLAPPAESVGVYDYSYDGALRSLADSFARMRCDRVDVALIHDIDRWTHGERQPDMVRAAVDGAYRALAELRAAGVVGAIGVGVNEADVAERAIREMDLDVVLLAGRYTLLEQGALAGFLPECTARNVSVVIGGPYNSGILATGPVAGALYSYAPALPHVLARVGRIEAVCKSHNVPLAAAALQFPLHHPAVATIIPGLARVSEVEATLALFQTDIPAALWRDLKSEQLLAADAPVG